MVVPTNRIPRFFRSAEIASESAGVVFVLFMENLFTAPMPEIGRKAAPLALNLKKDLCVPHRRIDLTPVADDTGVCTERRAFFLAESADRQRVKAFKRLPERLPLVEDALPGKAGLKAFQ